ncbi:MAG: hypothetical protein K0R25_938 [Rickettsiaceae bacterium]|jgi:glycosyltransferase involved in cell wall biosynthesis|nr:hypothetical protein [Rickettsiaceae bacterium]
MTNAIRPVIGTIADFSFNCPVAQYAYGVCEGLTPFFDSKILDLGLCDVKSPSNTLFEKFIINAIKTVDIVDIHLEFGLFGNNFDVVKNRLDLIFHYAKKIVITVHSLHIDGGGFEKFYYDLFAHIRTKVMPYKEVLIIVNNVGDKTKMDNLFNISNSLCIPLSYFTKHRIAELQQENILKNRSKIHEVTQLEPNNNDIFIGIFGFLRDDKDIETTIEALARLDKRYKLIIAGSVHPYSLKMATKEEAIIRICNLISKYEKQDDFIDRIIFLSNLDDKLFWKLMSSVDFVVINYLETRISGSSIAAQALQLGKKVIASNTTPFNNLAKLYKNCFEQMDCGNYFQLRQQILYFDQSKIESLKKCNEKWNMETLALVYKDFYYCNNSLFKR